MLGNVGHLALCNGIDLVRHLLICVLNILALVSRAPSLSARHLRLLLIV